MSTGRSTYGYTSHGSLRENPGRENRTKKTTRRASSRTRIKENTGNYGSKSRTVDRGTLTLKAGTRAPFANTRTQSTTKSTDSSGKNNTSRRSKNRTSHRKRKSYRSEGFLSVKLSRENPRIRSKTNPSSSPPNSRHRNKRYHTDDSYDEFCKEAL